MMPIFYISQVCIIELSMELCFELSMMTITSNHAWWVMKVTFYSGGWWFITKCGNVQHTFLEFFLNKHICHRRSIVKNSFGILKFCFLKALSEDWPTCVIFVRHGDLLLYPLRYDIKQQRFEHRCTHVAIGARKLCKPW